MEAVIIRKISPYIAAPTSRKKLRRIVTFIRSEFGLNDEFHFPIVPFLELGMSQIDSEFNFEVVDVSKLPFDYAKTYPEKKQIVIREDVYLNAIEGKGRDRFTIAHEIAHYILHRPKMLGLARNERKEKIPIYKDPEWQANTFAGEILAPPHLIKGMTVEEVAKACGVSLEVAKIQLRVS